MPTIFDQLAQPLSRLAARYAQSPIPRFLEWWGGELRSCLPLRWRERFRVAEKTILLRRDGDELVVSTQQGSDGRELGRLSTTPPESLPAALNELLDEDLREARRVLLLNPKSVLQRTLHLPPAAIENLSSVLGFELDRQTPFRADQVYFDSRVGPHPADAKQVPVQLALVTREQLAKDLSAINGLATTLGAVDVPGDGGSRAGFNFLPPDKRVRRSHTFFWMMMGLGALALFFLWFGMSQIITNRIEAVQRLEAEVDVQRNEARAVLRLREELDAAAAGANFLAVEKASQPSMLLLIDELTRNLPDDTFLERMSVSRGEIALAGQSTQAPSLVKLLQDGKTYRTPALSGAIQPDPRSGKDRFNIVANYGAQPGEDDAPDAGR